MNAPMPAALGGEPLDRIRLGELLLHAGLVTTPELHAALAIQQAEGGRLGEILVARGVIPLERLEAFLARQRRKVRLGALLVEEGLVSLTTLQQALRQQEQSNERLGRILIGLGVLEAGRFFEFFARVLDLPWVDLNHYRFNPELAALIPERDARRLQAVPLAEELHGLLVGMADPTDVVAFDELRAILRRPVRVALVSEYQLPATLDRIYRHSVAIAEQVEALDEEMTRSGYDFSRMAIDEMAVDAPVVRILRSLFEDAVQMNASDIHIEPGEQVLRIRQRIDGILHEQVVKEQRIAPTLVSKLKLMAGMEISEKRLPQDGRFHLVVKGRRIDVRVATLPALDGEVVVMRLLDQSARALNLEQVGMAPHLLKRFRSLLRQPTGLILVTGPTGSGKTTTLYGALNLLNVPEKKIITVEDPVEYRLPRVNQVHVRERIGLTFARVLRTVLRQDPDIILVGEMRDLETSKIAIRAALTGHLVLSTLHTNDAVSSVVRLVEMGVESYSVAAAVRAIISQRLLRRICPICAEPCPEQSAEAILLRDMLPTMTGPLNMMRGRGCAQCGHSGYMGRIAVVELLEMTRDLAEALRRGHTQRFYEEAYLQTGYQPMRQAALSMVAQGLTTLDEAMRVTGDEESWIDAPMASQGVDRGFGLFPMS